MANTVTFAGTPYVIPDPGDAYGDSLTNFLIAVAQKASVTTAQKYNTQLLAAATYTFTPLDTIIAFSGVTANAQLLPGEVGRFVGVFINNSNVSSELTVTPSVGQTINGRSSYVVNGSFCGVYLVFNGVEWSAISILNKVSGNRAFAANATNRTFLEGGITPFGSEQTVGDLQSATVTLGDFQFAKIFIEIKDSFMAELSVNLVTGIYSVLSDIQNVILQTDAGVGLVVTVIGTTVTFKSRFTTAVNIRIGILGPRIISQTDWV